MKTIEIPLERVNTMNITSYDDATYIYRITLHPIAQADNTLFIGDFPQIKDGKLIIKQNSYHISYQIDEQERIVTSFFNHK